MAQKNTLEGYRAFPIIAWTVCIGFAVFVYSLTQNLKATQAELAEANLTLEQRFDIANTSTNTPHTIGGPARP